MVIIYWCSTHSIHNFTKHLLSTFFALLAAAVTFSCIYMEQNKLSTKRKEICVWWIISLPATSHLILEAISFRIFDLLSGSKTSALFKIIKPQIYLGGSDWSIRGPLLTSHPPCPVLMLAKCLLSTEAFCWNKQYSGSTGWDNLRCITSGSSITIELRHW